MKITLKDIAEKANVSISAVSLVLNERPCRISDEKKKLIKDIANKYNYSTNQIARSLVTKQTKSLGLILPDIENIFFSSLAKHMEEYCRNKGFTLIIVNTNDRYEEDVKLLDFLYGRSVDGIFIIPSDESYNDNTIIIEKLKKLTIPFVMLDRVYDDFECDKVTMDNELGAYFAVKHLLDYGHRKIGCITNTSSSNGEQRLRGYERAMNEYGCEIKPTYIVEGDYRIEGGYIAGEKLIKEDVTAVFITNDMMSLGFLKILHEKNKKVPNDYSLVSYDNTLTPYIIGVDITAVEQDVEKLAHCASDLLLTKIKNPKRPPEEILLSPILIEKASVR